jgi:hypothetical protein
MPGFCPDLSGFDQVVYQQISRLESHTVWASHNGVNNSGLWNRTSLPQRVLHTVVVQQIVDQMLINHR